MSSLVFLDIETTGLKAFVNRIIEIYMLKVDSTGDVSEYHTMMNPEQKIPAHITRLTGITQQDIANAPIESQVVKQIRDFIGDNILIAHNLAFDRSFLVALFKRHNCNALSKGGIDTLSISRKLFPKLCIYPQGEGSHKLKNLMYHFNLDKIFANTHRAKDDVLLLIQVYRYLEQYAKGEGDFSFPRAMTHGCPRCGSVMQVVENDKRELVCLNEPHCNQRLVV